MGIEARRFKVGDSTFELTLFGTKTAQKVLVRLFRILGPAAASLMSSGNVGAALGMATSAATDEDLDFVTKAFSDATNVIMPFQSAAGVSEKAIALTPMYDEHFQGKLDVWAGWLGLCVKENFSSFLDGKALPDLFARLRKTP